MDIEEVAGDAWETAARREAAVRRLIALPDRERTRKAFAFEARRLGLSVATMFRLVAAWRMEPVRSALLPARRGPKRGSLRIPADKRVIIHAAIERFYAKREAPRVSDLVDEIAARCLEAGLKPPSRATVNRQLASFSQRRLVQKRQGQAVADEEFSITPGLVAVHRPLQRVQIDHTLADVFVVDEDTRLPIGRPYLTLAIDVFSRMVIGFHLTMDHPCALSVGLCLTQAVFDKGEWLDSRRIRHSWPCSGLPELLHLDNAAEFHSRALERGCEEHGIELQFRPKRTPRFGGHIERLIGTAMGALHLLPGTTRSSVADKRDYDPERHAALTLRQLERWIALEVVGKYHNEVHSSLGRPPLAVWLEQCVIPLHTNGGEMTRDPSCIFCQIVSGTSQCTLLSEDEAALAFMDIHPANEGHCLVIPKAHYATVFDTPPDVFAAVGTAAAQTRAASSRSPCSPPLSLRGDQFSMSPSDQFCLSPDTRGLVQAVMTTGLNRVFSGSARSKKTPARSARPPIRPILRISELLLESQG